jgi:hypothetical protein
MPRENPPAPPSDKGTMLDRKGIIRRVLDFFSDPLPQDYRFIPIGLMGYASSAAEKEQMAFNQWADVHQMD